jgi:hypothetical protein
MKRRLIKLILSLSLIVIFCISINNTSATTWEDVITLSGTGDKTTQSFTLSEDSRFVWTTTYDDEQYAAFAVFVYEVGEDMIYETDFDGLSGTSYCYAKGDFYLEVITANLNSWEVVVQQESTASTPTDGDNGDNLEFTSYPAFLLLFAIPAVLILRRKNK